MLEGDNKQVVVGYYTAPDGQVIPLMADKKYYPNGVPDISLFMPGQPVGINVPPMRQTPPVYSNVPPMQPKQAKSLENVVGKNLMGILASVLIFIGLILFATVAYEVLSDVARVVLIYLLSGLFLAVGRIGMHKNRNAFFLSLTGCGVGAVYISLFLTYGYFHLINGIALYILLAVWSVIVFFLGGRGSFLFKIIGQSGLLISVFYGCVMQLMESKSNAMLSNILVLMGFYMVITAFYLLMDSKKGVKVNLPFLIMDYIGAINLLMMLFHIHSVVQTGTMLFLVLVLLCYMLFLLSIYLKRIDQVYLSSDASIGWLFCVLFVVVYAAVAINGLLPEGKETNWIQGCAGLVYSGIVWLLTECRRRKDVGRLSSLVLLYLFLWGYSTSFGIFSDLFVFGIFAMVFLLAGFLKKDRLYFSLGCAGSITYVLLINQYPAVYSLFSILFLLLILVFQQCEHRIYHSGYKIAAYCMAQIFILRIAYILPDYTVVSEQVWGSVAYFVSVVLCIAATHSIFCRNWLSEDNGEKSTQIALGGMNIFLILWGFLALHQRSTQMLHVFTILFLLACCVHNILPMVKGFEKSLAAGIYIGIKLTFFMAVTLSSYEIESYLITIVCLVLALTFIIVGFLTMYRAIRLYGLILALYSIFKLVIFDVTYDSTLGRALTIMGCGVLAFIISFIYNRISKKMDAQEEERKA
ncbi:MAG: hypothetical protein ACI4DW_12270 [Lachnospiraceae bacterium]